MTKQSNCCKSKSNCSPTRVESELSCNRYRRIEPICSRRLAKADISKGIIKRGTNESEHQDIENRILELGKANNKNYNIELCGTAASLA